MELVSPSKKIIYTKNDLYTIIYSITKKHYTIEDRNGERVSYETFDIPADAIKFAQAHYKGLVG